MKNWILFGIVLFNGFLFAQPPIENLKKASDLRRAIYDKMNQLPSTGPSRYVNTFIGTGGHGHTYPGASAPFGMMQLSPDTRPDGWDGCGGYHYEDSIVYGFSHTHLSGTGIPDYADLLICPQVGNPASEPAYLKEGGYGHAFSHADEKASPGYYHVKLKESNIDVDLAVTERAGIHRYNFNGTTLDKYLILDLDYRDKVLDAGFELTSSSSLQGHRQSQAWAQNQHFYFYLETNVPWVSAKEITENGHHKMLLKFPSETRVVQVRVGMSAVDEEGAHRNLEKEINTWSLEVVKKQTTEKWDQELGKIDYYTADADLKTIFYTALYHSFLNPNLFSDIDGRYRGLDQQIHQLPYPESEQYTVFSLWDTFRAAHPLFTLTQQEKTKRFLETFERQYLEGGDLPVWELSANETECMIGYHSVSVITDAWMKGLKAGDGNNFLKAMLETANRNEFGKVQFGKEGYISFNKEHESVSKTLEFAYDDYCVSLFASLLKNEATRAEYAKRSFQFVNQYNADNGFFQARKSGLWFAPFRPEEVNFHYTEANAWQYSLFAPHAVGTLINLHGGKEKFVSHLDEMFTTSSQTSGRNQADITGLIGQYAHGNEPSHHMAYLYNYANRGDKTQFYIDKILKEQYRNEADGLAGNEDCGQMSAWYVMSAMGLYQVAPGNPYYDFGRPLADSVIIHLENGKSVKIIAANQSMDHPYIQNITWNGSDYKKMFVSHADLMNGGNLEFNMGKSPQSTFWTPAPTLSELPANFVPVPSIGPSATQFENKTQVSMRLPMTKVEWSIYYRFEGSDQWQLYTRPLEIDSDKTIYAKTKSKNGVESAVVVATYLKQRKDLELTLKSEFANQYAAGGPTALIDGIQGESDYRTGEWQGFYNQDVIGTIGILNPRNNLKVSVGYLEEMKSWIFAPKEVVIEYSTDGKTFTSQTVKVKGPDVNENKAPNKQMARFELQADKPIVMIRFTVKNYGPCPKWHLGDGNPTWIFLDEVIVE